MARQFHVLDVFTERAFEGNPLAVVLDSHRLDDQAMQMIAREFGLPETVFVLPPDDPVNSGKLRIFTPANELPFAGHPTVGTAILLAELHGSSALGTGGITIALEEKIGLVKVDVHRAPGRASRAVFSIPALPQLLALDFDPAMVACALGIDITDIGFGAHAISAWSAGVPFVMVPVRSLAVLAKVGMADPLAWRAAFAATGKGAAYVYTRETVKPEHHIHARMFAPGMGISEDPATGSATAAFAGVAATTERSEDGLHQIIIEQGFEMGRPSLIALDIHIERSRLVAAAIGGSAVRISEGRLLA